MLGKFESLPKWAQRYIEGLEERIDDEPRLLELGDPADPSFVTTRREKVRIEKRKYDRIGVSIKEWRRINAQSKA